MSHLERIYTQTQERKELDMGKIFQYFHIICFEFKKFNFWTLKSSSLFSFLSYANITIGKQFSHSSDLYDAAKLNNKVKESPVTYFNLSLI